MDLRFDHRGTLGQGGEGVDEVLGCLGGGPLGDGDAKLFKEGLGLELVDIH